VTTDGLSPFADLVRLYQWPKTIAVTGALGSGKTEWVLNLALGLKSGGEDVTIADVDIINPYFCVRQVSETLKSKGFSIITPPETAKWSDMSVINARVGWAVSAENGHLLLDIGGDAEGALALKQFEPQIKKAGYLLVLVVNAFRPMTSTPAKIETMLRKMESIGGLRVGALISNSHFMQETTAVDCAEGLSVVRETGRLLDLPVLYAGVAPALEAEVRALQTPGDSVPVWPVSRYMLLPWEDGCIWSQGDKKKQTDFRS
jgi:hypothetical protein